MFSTADTAATTTVNSTATSLKRTLDLTASKEMLVGQYIPCLWINLTQCSRSMLMRTRTWGFWKPRTKVLAGPVGLWQDERFEDFRQSWTRSKVDRDQESENAQHSGESRSGYGQASYASGSAHWNQGPYDRAGGGR